MLAAVITPIPFVSEAPLVGGITGSPGGNALRHAVFVSEFPGDYNSRPGDPRPPGSWATSCLQGRVPARRVPYR